MYIAVNKDGTEMCFNYEPSRYSELIKEWNIKNEEIGYALEEVTEDDYYWTDQSSDYYASPLDGIDYYNTGVKMPKGTIKTLIGRELTWDDTPINLDKLVF